MLFHNTFSFFLLCISFLFCFYPPSSFCSHLLVSLLPFLFRFSFHVHFSLFSHYILFLFSLNPFFFFCSFSLFSSRYKFIVFFLFVSLVALLLVLSAPSSFVLRWTLQHLDVFRHFTVRRRVKAIYLPARFSQDPTNHHRRSRRCFRRGSASLLFAASG